MVVARVGSTKITLPDYQRQYQRQLKRLAGALGPQFTDELAKQMGLPQQVLNQMVGEALFANLAKSLGLRPGRFSRPMECRVIYAFPDAKDAKVLCVKAER